VESVGRIFLAVGLPDATRHAIAAYLTAHIPPLPGAVVPPENWHLTLRFLGDVAPAAFDRLIFEVSEADLGAPFRLSFAGLGAFPKPARASVVWLGVDRGQEELMALASAVDHAVDLAGFGPDDRSFRPHLTLARLRPTRDVWPWLESEPLPPVAFAVGSVGIYRSHLGGGPARYELLDSVSL